jgi:DNA-binding transcriptional LysR family regulator
MAAMSGHGVSVGDLFLSLEAIRSGLLALPFPQAVATGEGYYLVWPKRRLIHSLSPCCINFYSSISRRRSRTD